jgi:hypothetical protein
VTRDLDRLFDAFQPSQQMGEPIVERLTLGVNRNDILKRGDRAC